MLQPLHLTYCKCNDITVMPNERHCKTEKVLQPYAVVYYLTQVSCRSKAHVWDECDKMCMYHLNIGKQAMDDNPTNSADDKLQPDGWGGTNKIDFSSQSR